MQTGAYRPWGTRLPKWRADEERGGAVEEEVVSAGETEGREVDVPAMLCEVDAGGRCGKGKWGKGGRQEREKSRSTLKKSCALPETLLWVSTSVWLARTVSLLAQEPQDTMFCGANTPLSSAASSPPRKRAMNPPIQVPYSSSTTSNGRRIVPPPRRCFLRPPRKPRFRPRILASRICQRNRCAR